MKRIILTGTALLLTLVAFAQDSVRVFSADKIEVDAHVYNVNHDKKGNVRAARADVTVRTIVRNNGEKERKAWVMQKLIDEEGNYVGKSDYAFVNVLPHDTASVEMTIQMLNVRLQQTEEEPIRFSLQTYVAPKNMKMKERNKDDVKRTAFASWLLGSLAADKLYEKERQHYGTYYTPVSFQ